MSINPLTFLISGIRYLKIGVLFNEQWLFAKYYLKGFTTVHEVGDKGQNNLAAVNSVSESTWSYNSKVVISETVLGSMVVKGEQDKVRENRTLEVSHDYSVAVISNASLYSNGVYHVSLFDCEGVRLLKYSNTKFGLEGPNRLKLKVSRYLHGTTLSLYGSVENTSGNIGHWVIDGVSRLFLVLKFYSIHDIDYVVVPKFKYGFQSESLIKLGISPEKIVELDVLECVSCENLIATTKPRGSGSSIVPGWLIDGYRNALLTEPSTMLAGKRIYITRRDAKKRRFVNEDEIVNCLEQLGFQVVEASSFNFEEKIKLFSDAEVVVGLTGAGLTNLLFCNRKAAVLELFPETFVSYFYASICSYLGLNYQSIIIKSDSLSGNLDKYHGDLYLDVVTLSNALDTLLVPREASEQRSTSLPIASSDDI